MRQLGSRYALERIIGRGATGEVWLAHESDGDTVAVKVLRPEFVDDTEVVARFLRERNVVRSVRSPHVVTVRDLVVEGSTLAIVMEYVPRADLRAFLRDNGGVLTPSVAVALTRQVLDALVVVHAAGVVHRDVKPENVLVDEDGSGSPVAKLSDFGVSRLLDGVTLTRVTGLIGTPRYMAPELASGTDPSAASDLYAVGIVLYELLTGRVPFSGEHPVAMLRAHVEQQPQRPKGIDSQLWKVLAKLLAKKPADRYADAAAALRALDEVTPRLDGLPALTDPRIEHTLHPTPRRRHDRPSMSMSFRRRHTHEVQLDGTRHRQHPRLMVGSASFAVVALVAAMFAVFGGSSKDTGERAWLDTYKDSGYSVTRDWQLLGKHGDEFTATETVMRSVDADPPKARQYTLVVPKSLAKHARDVHVGVSASTVKDDPVLAVTVGALTNPIVVTYTIKVAPDGRHSSRLEQWNKDMIAARRTFERDAKTKYTGPREVPKTTKSEPDLSMPERHAVVVAAMGNPPTTTTTKPPQCDAAHPANCAPPQCDAAHPANCPPPPCDAAHPANCPPPPCDAAHPANCPPPTCDSAHLGLCPVTGLSLDPQNASLDVGQVEVVRITGQTAYGAAPGDVVAKTALNIDNPAIATVGSLTADPSGVSASFTVQGASVGAATISAANGDVSTSLLVQVNPVPPPPAIVTTAWGQSDGSPCIATCTLTVAFQQPAGSTDPITGWTACLEPQHVCVPVTPDTSYASVLDSSSGALTGEFNAQIAADGSGESITITADTGRQSTTTPLQTIPPAPFQSPPPPPPPTQDTGTTAGPPAS